MWIRKNLVTLVAAACMITGAALLLYPTVSNYWNSFHQSRAIMSYNDAVSQMSKEDYTAYLDAAREYNARLTDTGMRWHMTGAELEEYNSLLDVGGTGIMGYVSMPKFHIRAPIYHGTDEAVLQTAIGHLEPSSLPVGGKGTHTLISGHRGLPSARLFTDIDRVREGDVWTLNILNETLTYECDQIRIVEPDDLSELQIDPEMDLCTLITCTPYGVNTHRLLVRGHRIANADGPADITADAVQVEPRYAAPFYAAIAILILLAVLWIRSQIRPADPEETVRRYLADMGMCRGSKDNK